MTKKVRFLDRQESEGNWISLMNPWISRARGWEENELWGRKSISLFQTIVMYPRPNVITCTVRVWLREIGFSLTYGALMLKTWRWVSSVTTRQKKHCLISKEINKEIKNYLLRLSSIRIESNRAHNFRQFSSWRFLRVTIYKR